MKKLLLIAGTHGNEKIGIEAIKKLKLKGYDKYFDILIGNPKALSLNKRFIDHDLNRAYPGDEYSKLYEKRLAYKNLKIARKYEYIIDIHEADKGCDDFIIVPRKKLSKKFPLDYIDLKTVLFWPNPKGPLSQVLPNSIELEFGSKNRNRQKMIDKCFFIIKKFIESACLNKNIKFAKKEYYFVYGKLLMDEYTNSDNLKDFKKINIHNERFYPLLVCQYKKDGIMCYKMKKME